MVTFPNILIYDGKRHPFNPANIVFHDPKPSGHGGFLVRQTYRLKDEKTGKMIEVPIYIQTPVMTSRWGKSEKEFDGAPRASLDLDFGTKDISKDVEDFHNVMLLWDAHIVATAIQRKSTWFKDGKLTEEILRYLYHSMVRKNEQEKDGIKRVYPDSIRMKIQKRYGRWECLVFDDKKNQLTLDALKPDTRCAGLMVNTGIWFTSKSWTSSNRVEQVKVYPSQKISGFGFVPTPEEAAAETEAAVVPPKPMMVDEAPSSPKPLN